MPMPSFIPGGVLGVYSPDDFYGEWDPDKYYAVGNVVIQGGSTYRSSTLHYSGATTKPGIGASWAANWNLIDTDETVADGILFNGCVSTAQNFYGRTRNSSAPQSSPHPVYGGGAVFWHVAQLNLRQRASKCVPLITTRPVGYMKDYEANWHHVDVRVIEVDSDSSIASDPMARMAAVQIIQMFSTDNGQEYRGTILEFNDDIQVQQIAVPVSAGSAASHSVTIPIPVDIRKSWLVYYPWNTDGGFATTVWRADVRAAFGSIVSNIASTVIFHKGNNLVVSSSGTIAGTVYVVTDLTTNHWTVQHLDGTFNNSELSKNFTLASSIDMAKSFLLVSSEQSLQQDNEQQGNFSVRLTSVNNVAWERTAASGTNNDGKLTIQVVTFLDSISRVERFYTADATGATFFDYTLSQPHSPFPVNQVPVVHLPNRSPIKSKTNYAGGVTHTQPELGIHTAYFSGTQVVRVENRGDPSIRQWPTPEVIWPQRSHNSGYNKWKNFADDGSFNQFLRREVPVGWWGKFTESMVGTELRDMGHFYHNLDKSGPTQLMAGTPIRTGHPALNFPSHGAQANQAAWEASQVRYLDRANQMAKVFGLTDEFSISFGFRIDSAMITADRTFFWLGNQGGASTADRQFGLCMTITGNFLRMILSHDSGGVFVTSNGAASVGGKYYITFRAGQNTNKSGLFTINGVQQTETYSMVNRYGLRNTRTFTFGINHLGSGGNYGYARNGWTMDHLAVFRRCFSDASNTTLHSRWMAEAGI